MYRRYFFLLVILTLVLSGTSMRLRAQNNLDATEVVVTVTEPSNVPRTSAVITSGVPIPTTDTQSSWALFDGAIEIPVQTTVLPGLKTPWLLLDFQSSLTAGQAKSFTLRQQTPAAAPTQPVTIQETASLITVTTGPLKAEISKTNYNVLENVWVDSNTDTIFSDPSERIIGPNAGSNIPLVDAVTGATYSGRGNVDEIIWEDQGALRSTLKVSGRYMNGATELLKYTTRISFFAGRRDVKIEHVLKNSVAGNERPVKISSAKVILGGNGSTVTATGINSRLWSNTTTSGTTLELIPTQFTVVSAVDAGGFRSATQTITTATNGGYVIGDLSFHGTTATFDFSTTLTPTEISIGPLIARAPLIAVAPNAWYGARGAFGAPEAATHQDEKDSYTKWGWAWNTTNYNQPYENRITHMPTYTVDHASVQGSPPDPEDDALWQDIFLLARTGLRGNYDRALGWANYSKWQYAYRTDGFTYSWGNNDRTCGCIGSGPNNRPLINIPNGIRTATDDLYLANNVYRGKMSNGHFWTGGLVDWFYLTGDRDALAASIDHAEVANAYFSTTTPGTYNVGENIRYPSRNYMVGLRVWEATQDPQWKTFVQHMTALFLADSTLVNGWDWWDETKGMYYTHAYDFNSSGQRDIGDGKFQTVWMAGITAEAFYRYYRLTEGDTNPTVVSNRATVAHRLIKMAEFFRDFTPDPSSGYTQEFVLWDWPNAGNISYPTRVDTYAILGLPPVTYVFTPLGGYATIDALTFGYRLTGDPTFLQAAKNQWDKASKRLYDNNNLSDPSQLIAGPNVVGKFSGNFVNASAYLPLHQDYELMYTHFFFYDAARLDVDAPGSVNDLRPI